MKRRHEDAELKASNDTVLEGMDWYFWVARAPGLIELSQITKNKVIHVLLGFFGWADICNLTGFPWCQEMSGKMSKFYVLALFLLQWDMISRITKRIMAKCQFHERLWGQSCICSKEKDPQSATHFLAFATSDDFGTISTQTATIKSQLKNTLGHLRLWQSIARIRTQRLLFQRQMIGEEIELFRYAQRNGYYPPFKSRFESMIFRFLFGWICDRFPGGYVYNTRMRGMVIPLYCALWKIRVETSSSGIGMPLKWPMDTPNSDGETCTRWEKNQL